MRKFWILLGMLRELDPDIAFFLKVRLFDQQEADLMEALAEAEEDDRSVDDGAVKVDSDEEYAGWIWCMYKYSWLAGMIFAAHN